MVRRCVRFQTGRKALQHYHFLAVVCAVGVAAAACGEKSPAAPTTPVVNTPTATGLSVRGCAEAEGYQCRAFVAYDDGTEEDVSTKTRWQPLETTDERLTATFDVATGRLTPKFAGTVTVTGQYQDVVGPSRTAKQVVDLMMPPVVLNGYVSAPGGRGVPGARLTVASGPSAGTATTTDSAGRWALTVIPTIEIALEVTHPQYNAWTFGLWLTIGEISRVRDLSVYPIPGGGAPPPPSPPTPAPPAPVPPSAPSAPATITEDFSGQVEDSYASGATLCADPRAYGQSVRCRVFTLVPSPHRRLAVDLAWRNWAGGLDSELELGVRVRQGSVTIATSLNNVRDGTATILYTDIAGNKPYEVEVLLLEGDGPARFTMRTTRSGIY